MNLDAAYGLFAWRSFFDLGRFNPGAGNKDMVLSL